MFTLIILAVLLIGVGYFATQNTNSMTLTFGDTAISNIPIYIAVLIPFFIGLVSAWITNIRNDIEHRHTRKRLKEDLADARDEIGELTKRVHKLELENTKLKAESGKPTDEDSL